MKNFIASASAGTLVIIGWSVIFKLPTLGVTLTGFESLLITVLCFGFSGIICKSEKL